MNQSTTPIPHGGAHPDALDFSANISPFGAPPAAQSALSALALNSAPLARYPQPSCAELRGLLAQFWSLSAQNIVCGAGAADVIFALVQTFSRAHKKIVVVEPAFSEYARAAAVHGCAVEHYLLSVQNGFALTESDVARLSPLLSGADVLFVASPANPTGAVIPPDLLLRLSALCEEKSVLLVVDACFTQFSAGAEQGMRSLLSRRADFPHTVVLNAFTKFYGLAGVRLGYALCFSESVATRLAVSMRPWAVSADAQALGTAILQAELAEKQPQKSDIFQNIQSDWEKRTQALVLSERERLTTFLRSLGYFVIAGEANYILFRADDTHLTEKLLRHGIAIRSCADFFGLDSHWYRIAIRSSKENARLIDALQSRNATLTNFPKENAPSLRPQGATLMVQGTMSNAGKSLLVAALCRIFRQDGYRVAPFKSQNMALNSGVTTDGLEMGRAQIMQAEAAGVLPDVRMNPILLKPTGETGSQVIVNGVPQGVMGARDYFAHRASLMPQIVDAYQSLAAEHDIIVIEGAGSPAEINLKKDDIVNMGLAERLDAPVLLVGDIDRGGVFASLFGTVALLEASERARIKGLVINKFRGDVSLLQNGLDQIRDLTGIPVLGVIPWMQHLLIDDEDSLSEQMHAESDAKQDAMLHIGVVRLPYLSNFTDLQAFSRLPFVQVSFFDSLDSYAEAVTEYGEMDMFVVPGTKNTVHALSWLVSLRLDKLIVRKAKSGVLVAGICGGFQLLGTALHDADGNEDESAQKTLPALGLLPVATTFTAEKTRTQLTATLPKIEGVFKTLSGCAVRGYEIHHGVTARTDGEQFSASENLICTSGTVLGTYIHGFFDSDAVSHAFISLLCARKGVPVPSYQSYQSEREAAYDRLAATVRKSLDMQKVYDIIFAKN